MLIHFVNNNPKRRHIQKPPTEQFFVSGGEEIWSDDA